MVERLAPWEVTIYHTDKWGTYAAVLPAEKLVMSKTGTGRMEWNHCRQRHWFGRFKRKSIIVSKSQGDGGSHHGAFCELLGEWESSRTSITTLLKLSKSYLLPCEGWQHLLSKQPHLPVDLIDPVVAEQPHIPKGAHQMV
jgi:hypothetical protein